VSTAGSRSVATNASLKSIDRMIVSPLVWLAGCN
jgi:hypothetical protein